LNKNDRLCDLFGVAEKALSVRRLALIQSRQPGRATNFNAATGFASKSFY